MKHSKTEKRKLDKKKVTKALIIVFAIIIIGIILYQINNNIVFDKNKNINTNEQILNIFLTFFVIISIFICSLLMMKYIYQNKT